MSLAARPTTKAEEALLRAHGFMSSPFESGYVEVDGERLYQGNWIHKEYKAPGNSHFGPDEALAFLKERLAEFARTCPNDG
jgi:hypothetical protein